MKKKKTKSRGFYCIPLGVAGGLTEGNLPAYLLAPKGSADFICLDTGTLVDGLKVAIRKKAFRGLRITKDPGLSPVGSILRHHVKAYLVTHPYLDHLVALVTVSPNDSPKPIIGSPAVLNNIRDHIFNWKVWPNLCNEGAAPATGQYRYVRLSPAKSWAIPETVLAVRAIPLAHGTGTDSTAFFVESREGCVLYMGDTGPDEIEKRATTANLWRVIAPSIRAGRLRGIFIEASYPDERPDPLLFSHLTPAWLMHGFRKLAKVVDPENSRTALAGLKIVITHIKPDFAPGIAVRAKIIRQLHHHNDLGLNLIIAEQGVAIDL